MASFPCPYCGRALETESEAGPVEQCPSCAGGLVLGYRYRLLASRGKISGGELYEAVDDIFGGQVAVLFAPDPKNARAVAGFVEGNRLFGELGGGRGLVKLRDLGTISGRRPHAVIDWLSHGTLDQVVQQRGPLDQAMLHELVSDLLVGLGKAHRAMPSLVHGHIHPGKIGFVGPDQAVLFGFEHARQVFEQDSHLADAFVVGVEDSGPTRATDLQQLGVSLAYAATGEWPGKLPVSEQVARVQQKLSGPLATVLGRMIAAGTEQGYNTAIEALIDFDNLLDGTSKWQARMRVTSTAQQAKLDAAAWTPTRSLEQDVEADEEEVEELEELESEDFADKLGSILNSEPSRRSPPPQTPNYAIAGQVGQAQQRWQPPKPKPAPAVSGGRIIAVVMGSMVAFAMCVGAIVGSDDDRSPPPEPVRYTPPVEAIPTPPIPELVPEPDQPAAVEEPVAMPSLSGIHHYVGKVSGPEDRTGIDLGARCEVWIEPMEGDLNCRFYIDCGKPQRRIYGGGDVGYTTCMVEEGHPTIASDEDMDAPDGAFMASLNGPEPMVIVQDVWLNPPVRALISISDGGPDDGPIPDVNQADRKPREQIEAAIAAGEVPDF